MYIKILFLFFLIYITKINSVIVPTDETSCLNNFFTKLNILSSYSILDVNNNPDYCNTSYQSSIHCYTNGSISYLSVSLSNPQVQEIISDDIICLPYLTQLYLTKVRLNIDFMYTPFQSLSEIEFRTCINAENITRKIPPISSFNLYSSSNYNNIVYMSYIEDIETVTIHGNYQPSFITDAGAKKTVLLSLSIQTNTIPDLTGYSLQVLIIEFGNNFDSSTRVNFETFKDIYGLQIYSFYTSNPFPIELLNIQNQFQDMYFQMLFTKLQQDLDFSKIKNLKQLFINDINFNLCTNNSIPISAIPSSLTDFAFQSKFKFMPQLDMYSNLDTLTLSGDSMNDTLKSLSIPSKTFKIDLSNNKLSGTISQSYCYTIPNFSGNLYLSGSIPNCFKCYFSYTPIFFPSSIKSWFPNQLSNYNTSEACTSIIPNLKLVGNNLILYGESLGFDYWGITSNLTGSPTWLMNIPSKEFQISLSMYFIDISKYKAVQINIPYTISKYYQFTLAPVPTQPNPVNLTFSNNQITIGGTFFTYNSSDIQVLVGDANETCTIISTTFFNVTCQFNNFNSLQLPLSKVLITLKVSNFTVQFYSKLQNNFVNKKTCTVKCTGNSLCNYEIGSCNCTSGWVTEPLCNIVSLSCPNDCSSNGNCDSTTGICECFLDYQGSDCSEKKCPNDCSNHGSCNTFNGTCSCSNGYSGVACDQIKCPNDGLCSLNGQCNLTNGTCICNKGYQGTICNEIQCPIDGLCSLNGLCNLANGQCQCNILWTDSICSTPNHYISSIDSPNENGGNVALNGWFGNIHNGLSILIGSLSCLDIKVIDSYNINCTIGAGKGYKKIELIQNNLSWSNDRLFKYQLIENKCPNDCSNKGKCNNGICQCFQNSTGLDCNSIITNSSNSNVNETTGSSSLTNGDFDFLISISSLIEIDIGGNSIKKYNLLNKWKFLNQTQDKLIHTFTQKLNDNNNNETILFLIIEEIKNNSKQFSFAGIDFKLDIGSIKLSLGIYNYSFANSLNTLQIQINSNYNQLDQSSCNQNINSNDFSLQNNDLLNYLTIQNGNKILYSRFINRMISDGKPTQISTSLIEKNSTNLIIALNIPHCSNECLLDPDFSLLISSNLNTDDCLKNDSKKTIIISVAVAGSVILLSMALAVSYLIYRKKFVEVFPSKSPNTKLKKFKKSNQRSI